jgi:DNA mismatch repair ATPase MutL
MKKRIISALIGIGISLILALSDASAATTAAQQQAAARKAQQQQQAQQAQIRKIQQQQQAQQKAYMAQQQKFYQAQQKAYQAQQKAYQEQQKKALETQQKEAAKKQAEAAANPDKTAKDNGAANGIAKGLGGLAGMAKATSSKRIEQDVNKGYLAPDEVAKLDKEQAAIVKLQKRLTADGAVGKDDAAQLRGMVKDTSLAIWVQKHDAEGGQKPAFRLGENLRLNPDVAAKLGDENLETSDARKILTDFHALCQDKKQLNGDLAAADRAKLQKQYDDRLNQYFALK